MKEKLSFTTQIRLMYTGMGFCWILAGTFRLFEGVIFLTLEAVMVLSCGLITVYIAKAKKEEEDEMASENLCKAKAQTLDIMHYIFYIIVTAAMILIESPWLSLDWSNVILSSVFIEMGLRDILIGSFFAKLEAA